ncbi:MAG: DUF3179 domain-containing (seleno)protein [Planctomycetota bacterium]
MSSINLLARVSALLVVFATVDLDLAMAADPEFKTMVRPGAVELEKEFDLTGLSIPMDEIHRLLPKDRIPALTDPETESAKESAAWLKPQSRLIEVQRNGRVFGVPLQILDAHEIVNTTLGEEPIAITYCPLCDSAVVFSRRIETTDGKAIEMAFGTSGALYNSNVLMYDRTHNGLWTQLGMKAVSGPLVGTTLTVLPFKLKSYEAFLADHPTAPIVSRNTSYQRDYTRTPYASYFYNDRLAVPVKGIGKALKKKTRGVGVIDGNEAYFLTTKAIGDDGYTLETSAGTVKLSRSKAGVAVESKPDSVLAVQTLYYSWSAFYPETKVINEQKTEQ